MLTSCGYRDSWTSFGVGDVDVQIRGCKEWFSAKARAASISLLTMHVIAYS